MALLDLATQMQWPFAFVLVSIFVSLPVIYLINRISRANDAVVENRRLHRELANIKDGHRLIDGTPG